MSSNELPVPGAVPETAANVWLMKPAGPSLVRRHGRILEIVNHGAAHRTAIGWNAGADAQPQSTKITLISFTLVSVGPGSNRSPVDSKNVVASLLSR